MRMLTSLEGQANAESLVAYLLTLQISTHVEPSTIPGQWEIWIRDEDRLDEARRELDAFLANPADPKYSQAVQTAQQILTKQRKERQEAKRHLKNGRGLFRSDPRGGGGGVPPITLTLVILAVIVSLLTNFSRPEQNEFAARVLDEMRFVSEVDYRVSQQDPAASLRKWELWRVLTPIFPHGNPLHLLFNILGMLQLGRIVESREGSRRYLALVILTGVCGNLFQGLLPANLFGYPFFGGLSGVVFGVFGFLWIKGLLRPELGLRLTEFSIMIMLGWLVLGFTGALGGIANMAHLGGLLAGMLLGYYAAIEPPLTPKR